MPQMWKGKRTLGNAMFLHYCPDCYEFDDKLDKYVPKKKG